MYADKLLLEEINHGFPWTEIPFATLKRTQFNNRERSFVSLHGYLPTFSPSQDNCGETAGLHYVGRVPPPHPSHPFAPRPRDCMKLVPCAWRSLPFLIQDCDWYKSNLIAFLFLRPLATRRRAAFTRHVIPIPRPVLSRCQGWLTRIRSIMGMWSGGQRTL